MAYLTKRSRLLLFLSAMTIVDCSGLAPEETYVSRLAVAQCTWARSCCEVSELQTMLGLDGSDAYSVEIARQALATQERCVDLMHARYVTAERTLLESIRSGRTKLDSKNLDACIQQYSKAKDGCTLGIASKALTDACKDEVVFVGQQAAGGVCYLGVDCAAGTTCWQPGGASQPGICRAKAADGAACRTSDECPDTDSCSPVDARDSWCSQSAKQASGQFCSIDEQCADGLFCDTNAQACAALQGSGLECFQNRQCLSNRCNKDLRTCDPQAKASEPCASSAHCESGLYCDASQASNSCAVPLSTGEAGVTCSSVLPCKAGLACIGTICRSPLQDGAACSSSPECVAASYCDPATDTCKPRKTKSASCSATSDCAAGLYCSSSSSYVCVDRIAAGQACTGSTTCIEGTRCNAATGTCDALLAAGSSCSTSSQCAQGLLCQTFAGRCASRVASAAMCESSDACPATEYCGTGGGRLCQKPLKVGLNQSCNSSSAVCDDGLFCSSGTCRTKVPVGGTCSQTSDCVASAYCSYYLGAYSCTQYAALGAPCTTAGRTPPICPPATVCSPVTDGGVGSACEPAHTLGQSCTSPTDCATGLYCSSPSHTCATSVAEGGSCTSTAQCATGLDCNATTDLCTARVAENASCAAQTAICAMGLYCRTFGGSCVTRLADGQTCQNATACATALECTAHDVCRAKAQSGEQCRSDRPCATGLRCDAEWGKCVALQADLKLGTTCRDGAECASGVCTNQECTGFCQGVSQ